MMNRKLVLLLTPKKSCLEVRGVFFKIRILQSRSPTANDSFPLLAWLCVHVSAGGELDPTSAPGQRKEKKVKGWRRIINPVSGGIFFTGLGHFHQKSFGDEQTINVLGVAWTSEHSSNSTRQGFGRRMWPKLANIPLSWAKRDLCSSCLCQEGPGWYKFLLGTFVLSLVCTSRSCNYQRQ